MRFCGDYPSVVVGRTFAKAYGLAGIRAGAVVGHPETIAALRRMTPPYSLNVCAAAALPAAFADRAYYDWYVDQVAQSQGAALPSASIGSAFATGRVTPISCSRGSTDAGAISRRRLPRAAFTSAIARATRAARDCLRVTAGRRRAHPRISRGTRGGL